MDFSTQPDYRAQAEKCLAYSERSKDGGTKLHWLAMAQAYFAIADAVETNTPRDTFGRPIHHTVYHPSLTKH